MKEVYHSLNCAGATLASSLAGALMIFLLGLKGSSFFCNFFSCGHFCIMCCSWCVYFSCTVFVFASFELVNITY
jgi:hypothetical protein